MLLVQSVLFFILGAAFISFVMLLLAPVIWRRCLVLATRTVRMEIPLSLNEVEAEHDFARAAHAVELCRIGEKLAESQEREMAARLAFDKVQATLCYLEPFEEETFALQQKIIQMRAEIANFQRISRFQQQKLEEFATWAKKHANLQVKAKMQGTDIKALRRQISALKRHILRLEKQNNLLEQNILSKENKKNTQAKDKEKWGQDLAALRHDIMQIAAQIVADIARQQEEEGNTQLVALIESNAGQSDLAGAIHHALTSAAAVQSVQKPD